MKNFGKSNINRMFLSFLLVFCISISASAVEPTISFLMQYTTGDQKTDTLTNGEKEIKESGPIRCKLYYRVTDLELESYKMEGEWREWRKGGSASSPDVVRRDSTTTLDVTTSQTHYFAFFGTLTYTPDGGTQQTKTIDEEWWNEDGRFPFTVTATASELVMPNAFSPNGDGANDVYKAKKAVSIVEFRAMIFNRWGQKIYEWNDVNGGWDGTHNGKDVSDGAYFCLVKAKGADGQEFTIKTDVNILRGYDKTTNSTTY